MQRNINLVGEISSMDHFKNSPLLINNQIGMEDITVTAKQQKLDLHFDYLYEY